MCRSIRTLYNFDPPATEEEVRAAALQFVRKIAGCHHPSAANEAAFARAVDGMTGVARELLGGLVTRAPRRHRDVEAAKAKARSARRFGGIRLRRVYDRSAAGEGKRFLVERLWPRGVKKEALAIDGWLREVAPSTELREWFSHDPKKWEEFRRRYEVELTANAGAWRPLLDAARAGAVTLLFSSRDTEHNCAVALRDFIERSR
jgi:uncharacterized protein YeaO (DUF488 family)